MGRVNPRGKWVLREGALGGDSPPGMQGGVRGRSPPPGGPGGGRSPPPIKLNKKKFPPVAYVPKGGLTCGIQKMSVGPPVGLSGFVGRFSFGLFGETQRKTLRTQNPQEPHGSICNTSWDNHFRPEQIMTLGRPELPYI